MLLATAIAAKSTQNCLKTISSRFFEIPPKIEFFGIFQKEKLPCVDGAPKHVYTIWIFIPSILPMPILLSKNGLCM
jgi:hypothetical protein